MRRIIKNENGVSLVEIIASLIIISILLVSFFNFFVQSSKHTKYNEETLTSVQVGEDIISKVRNITSEEDLIEIYDFERVGGKYVSVFNSYTVQITVSNGPVTGLKKALVSVNPLEKASFRKSDFLTEVYFKLEGY